MQQFFSFREESLIDAPNAWSIDLPEHTGQHGVPLFPHREQPSSWMPEGLNKPCGAVPQTAWPVSGNINEVDASSTISPLSPQTPGDRSDVDVNIAPMASPWPSGLPNSATYPIGQVSETPKVGNPQPYGGSGNPLREIQKHPDDCIDDAVPGEGPPEYESNNLSHLGTGLEYHPHNMDSGEYLGISEERPITPRILDDSPDPSVSQDEGDQTMTDAEGEDDEEYSPLNAASHTHVYRQPHHTTRPSTRPRLDHSSGASKTVGPHDGRIAKNTRSTILALPSTNKDSPKTNDSAANTCDHCSRPFASLSTLNKHTQTTHTRPFTCIFHIYGCPQTFGSKNEWARHIRVQHLRLEVWRCDLEKCHFSRNAGEKKGEFDRKDLFTQHVRRMHPTALIGKSNGQQGGKGTDTESGKMNRTQFEMSTQTRCHRVLRSPPQHTICPWCPGKGKFDSWDARLEHVSKHLETGNWQGRVVEEDLSLRRWLKQEGLLSPDGKGGWRIVGLSGKKQAGKGKPVGGKETKGMKSLEEEDADGETEVEM